GARGRGARMHARCRAATCRGRGRDARDDRGGARMSDIHAAPEGTAGAVHGRILFLSHSHSFGPFRVGSHHLARTLAQRGAEVVHLSTPISVAHRVTGRVSASAVAEVPAGP